MTKLRPPPKTPPLKTARPAPPPTELDLSGVFTLTSPARDIKIPIELPGDVHTALLAAGEIADPYFGVNEAAIMWVNHTPWTMERRFSAPAGDIDGYLTLILENVDCIATIWLNGEEIARTQNQFVRYDIDVTGKVRMGTNTLRLEFAVTRDIAKSRAAAHPFPIPFTFNYQTNGLEGVPLNFVRKSACHAGWDWGICLMPTGVYGRMVIRRSRLAREDSVTVAQAHGKTSVELSITTRVFAFAEGSVELSHTVDAQRIDDKLMVRAGENVFTHHITIHHPKLWWPSGQGDQALYPLTTTVDGQTTTRRIGLRQLDWVIEPDEIDHCFKVRVNGRDVTAMGANWIPADAIPARIAPAIVRDLLESARAANMNMIRVWGGGQYEPDYFYELCDELGLLVWQDFMFACMSYPSNREFLDDVRTEATQQVRRLSHHASLALWCGDNEVIGSLDWYPETKADPKRYIANYDRLNSMLQSIVTNEDPGRRFWPSSPSLGYLDFSDGWHVDTRGDMHYWDVWHAAKPFEAYRSVNPRFASEFGFQSFPSMDVIERFSDPADRYPSSPVMESHQRNAGGNARILETMARHFRPPADFDQMVYLSQIQQGLAIKTAIEYWRSTKPRCMGTLYWQLNDIYPVASWSSLNHGGGWKLLHYLARRFYLPVNVVAIPDAARGDIGFFGINDSGAACDISLDIDAVRMDGGARQLQSGAHLLSPDAATELGRVPMVSLDAGEFLVLAWRDAAGALIGTNDFVPGFHKDCDLPDASVTASWTNEASGPMLTLSTDKPAFFVAASVETPGYFSDNAITLLPGRDMRLGFTPRFGARVTSDALAAGLRVRHLRQTY